MMMTSAVEDMLSPKVMLLGAFTPQGSSARPVLMRHTTR